MGSLEAEESTAQHLASLILKRLKELKVPFKDCRGQSYINGANMRVKHKGVEASLKKLTPELCLCLLGLIL